MLVSCSCSSDTVCKSYFEFSLVTILALSVEKIKYERRRWFAESRERSCSGTVEKHRLELQVFPSDLTLES